MGAYKVTGFILEERIYEDYFKFVNYAKEYLEKNIVKEPMRWKGNISSTHDINIKGIEHKGVTFVIDSLHFKAK